MFQGASSAAAIAVAAEETHKSHEKVYWPKYLSLPPRPYPPATDGVAAPDPPWIGVTATEIGRESWSRLLSRTASSLSSPSLSFSSSSASGTAVARDMALSTARTIDSVAVIRRCLVASERFSLMSDPCQRKSNLWSVVNALFTAPRISGGVSQCVRVVTNVARPKETGIQMHKSLVAPRPTLTLRTSMRVQCNTIRSREIVRTHSL
mmetsp:Transcript_103319/g.287612  ORF Transcript_103319/g.287612 Transcript_103319/m.287612 type:complete len:207 (-) Transcript_103319:2321-2941(-)